MGFKYTFILVSLLIVSVTFNLNGGPFAGNLEIVSMVVSSHGNLFLFSITAIFGSLFIVFLSQLTPASAVFLFIGQNTIILLGLNGLFDNFFNLPIANIVDIFFAPNT